MPPCSIHKLSDSGSHEQRYTTPHIIFCHAHPVCPLPDQTQSTTCSSCKQSESGFVGAPSHISRTKMATKQMQRKQREKQIWTFPTISIPQAFPKPSPSLPKPPKPPRSIMYGCMYVCMYVCVYVYSSHPPNSSQPKTSPEPEPHRARFRFRLLLLLLTYNNSY